MADGSQKGAPRADTEAEAACLSWALIDHDAALELIELLDEQDYFFDAHRQIHRAVREVCVRGDKVDLVAVVGQLQASGALGRVGGQAEVAKILDVPATARLAQHARTVRNWARVRKAQNAFRLLAAEAQTADLTDIDGWLDSAERRAYEATASQDATKDHSAGYRDAWATLQAKWDEADARDDRTLGVATGYLRLDEHTGGMRPGQIWYVGARPGQGKCLGRGTRVLLYSGDVVPVESIEDGDLLMGPDSRPRLVRSTARGIGPLFRIRPTKGSPWVCNWCHVLTLVHSSDDETVDVPLDEYERKNQKFKHQHKLFAVGVDFHGEHNDLPIDPYIVGVWIGDGAKDLAGFRVSKPDAEIEAACRDFASANGYRFSRYDGATCPTYQVSDGKNPSPFLAQMRALFPDAPQLRIPAGYLRSTRESRLQLLAGLLDTDGNLTFSNFEITQKQKALACDIAFLARSLGFHVREGTRVVNGTEYARLLVVGDCSVIPTRIPRKRAPARRQVKSPLRTGFTVEPIGDGEYFGFTLDGDGRFLLGDFTVTHNTAWAQQVAEYVACRGGDRDGVIFLSMEMTIAELFPRALARESGYGHRAIERRKLDQAGWDSLASAAAKVQAYPIEIDDEKRLTPLKVRAKVRRLKAKMSAYAPNAKLRLVVVDYVQLMRSDRERSGENRATELGEISRSLKEMAGEFDCTVLALSQLARHTDKSKPPPQPTLFDFRDSGAIEADGDVVIGLHRPDQWRKPGVEPTHVCEVHVLKGRGCGEAAFELKFEGPTTRFENIYPEDDKLWRPEE